MKLPKFLTYTVFVLFLTMTISSCTGDDGPAGQDGNANVKVGTLDLTSSDWLWHGSYTFSTANTSSTSYYTRYVDIDVPEITESIFETGLVLVYYKPDRHADNWEPLSFQFTSFGGVYTTNIAFRTELSKIRLHYFWSANSGNAPTGLETYPIADSRVKYIVIEGSAIGTTARTTQANNSVLNELNNVGVDVNDYYAVCAYYGINPE